MLKKVNISRTALKQSMGTLGVNGCVHVYRHIDYVNKNIYRI